MYSIQQPQVIQPVQQPAYMYSIQQPQIIQPVPQPVYVQPQVIQPVQQPVYVQPQVIQPVSQVVVVESKLSDVSGQTMCPNCHNTVTTRTEYKIGMLTWLLSGLLAIFLLWPLCLIPFCVTACKDVKHTCPLCNRVIYIYKRM